jgi:hypothetical protein
MPDFIHPERPFREWVEQLKAKLNADLAPGEKKFKIRDLLALSLNSDPFWAGAARGVKLATWFQTIWSAGRASFGDYLRRIHYALLSRPTKNASLQTYQNTDAEWEKLQEGSRQARHLELVGADQLVDQSAVVAIPDWVTLPATSPTVVPPELPVFTMPHVWISSGQIYFPECPTVQGYYPNDHHDRAVYLSLWIEKNTQYDILQPICQELGLELVTLTGKSSITAPVQFLLRCKELKKDGCIFYISDFDPDGLRMPPETARKLEFYKPIYAPDVHITVRALALTAEQVRHYKLPRNTVKESNRSKVAFEKQYGGAVELDALEGVHPGELEKLIRAAIAPYDDLTLPKRLNEARRLAENLVMDAWRKKTRALQEEHSTVRKQIERQAQKYSKRVQALQKSLEDDLKPFQRKLKRLEQQAADAIQGFKVDLDQRPSPEIEPDEKDCLFDSSRDYLTQMRHYRRHKTGLDGPLEGTGHRLAVPTRGKNRR